MKFKITLLCTLVMVFLAGMAAVASSHDDVTEHRDCIHCGMDRKAFGYSRMLVTYEDGNQAGVCSLHCAVTELNLHKEKKVKSLLVADRDTRQLIEAEKAIWVMGGTKRGVMTQRPKWAFASTAAAQKFSAANGGTIVSWNEALSAARQDAAPNPR